MTDVTEAGSPCVMDDPTTLRIERLLPGPLDRAWRYLTVSDLRRQWLASGEMTLEEGASFELVWRNEELSDPPGTRPEGFPEEHRMTCRIVEVDAPRKLVFTWGEKAEVMFQLEERGDDVLFTVIHSRVTDRAILLNVSAGWHAHLDVLVARANGRKPESFWDRWLSLKSDYERRLNA
ncbi:SRPBCC family protein [Rhodospirillaceae bacterium KN72]|uniref:SRPBCC family protein n=1 Tax=Pacificispira spongiicola TaxID=2729598 RepID=A0A7Y0DZ80_9PROT|nr:SRPBCC family protein [Pacificispira spongiicola]NMM44295.1 SRPBCC family protein [Pacificispira spongiicola]